MERPNRGKILQEFKEANKMAYGSYIENEYHKRLEAYADWQEKQLLLHGVSNSLPENDIDAINGNFAQAERALLRIDPSGENPDPTEIFELLQWFRDKLLGNDC